MKTEKNILIAFLLNISFALIEFIGGLFTNSIALLSDAIHDIGDSLSIGLSFFLEKKSKQEPDEKYTFGYARYSILGAVITTTILLVGSIVVIINAIKKIINPVTINYNGMIIFSLFGLFINFIAAYTTKEGDSLNQKSVNLHMLEDVLGWIIVFIGAIIMKFTDISIIDPILSILVAIFIFINSMKNLKSIVDLFLEKTPIDITVEKVRQNVLKIKDVEDIHHIHIWSIDGYNNYATMHVVVKEIDNDIKVKIRKEMKKLNISHVTIELETIEENCEDKKCHIHHESNHIGHHH